MAEVVQEILDGMVPALRDLSNKGIFSESEVHAIVSRRRESEYLLRRRAARKADFLRYAEAEMALERLRKLRQKKLLAGRITGPQKEKFDQHNARQEARTARGGEKNSNEDGRRVKAKRGRGSIGDTSIVRNVHFIFSRARRKWAGDLSLHLEHASFARQCRSNKQLSRIYAEALQVHPRNAALWIEAASHEFFGRGGGSDAGEEEDRREGKSQSTPVGGSIRNARVLLQRGLRVNPTAQDLWVQYFALEWHYVQKLRGRREILQLDGTKGSTGGSSDAEDDNDNDGNEDGNVSEDFYRGSVPAVIFSNAIRAVPDDVGFRLKFLDLCGSFPQTELVEAKIVESIERDFGDVPDAWIARAAYVLSKSIVAEGDAGMLSTSALTRGLQVESKGSADDESTSSEEDSGENNVPKKRKRADDDDDEDDDDDDETRTPLDSPVSRIRAAMAVLDEAMSRLPTPVMYEKVTEFVQSLMEDHLDDGLSSMKRDDGSGNNDGSEGSLLVSFLDRLFDRAASENVTSPNILSTWANYLVSTGRKKRAIQVLTLATKETYKKYATLWLQLAQIVQSAKAEGVLTQSQVTASSILRRAMKSIPVYEPEHMKVVVSLFDLLLLNNQRSNPSDSKEISDLYQRILLLPHPEVPAICLRYLQYSTLQGGLHASRAVYETALFKSSLATPSGARASNDMLQNMDTFFDACIRLEKSASFATSIGEEGQVPRNIESRRLRQIYDVTLGFFKGVGAKGRTRKYQGRMREDVVY